MLSIIDSVMFSDLVQLFGFGFLIGFGFGVLGFVINLAWTSMHRVVK